MLSGIKREGFAMTNITPRLYSAAAILFSALVAVEPALAGRVVPAPVIGLGAPVLVLLAGGYWLVQRARKR